MTPDDRTDDQVADEFRRLIDAAWGYGAQTKAAKHFGVTDRAVRRWVAGDRRVPDTVLEELRALASIPGPPDTDDDDALAEACANAIEPALTELRNRANAAGWHPADVAVAIINVTLGDIRAQAGDDATRLLLRDALVAVGEGE